MVKKFQLIVKRFHPKWDWEWAVFQLICFYLLSVWYDVCGHACAMVRVWQAEENSVESFLAFHIYKSSQD